MLTPMEAGAEDAALRTISNAVEEVSGVSQAMATLWVDEDEEEILALYVTLDEQADTQASSEQIRMHLEDGLSEDAVPDVIVYLDRLPDTVRESGDPSLLPHPEPRIFDPATSAQAELIFEIIAKTFGLPKVRSADTFLDLGGTSLLVSRMVSLLRSELNVEVSFRDVVDAESIGSLTEGLTVGTPVTKRSRGDRGRTAPEGAAIAKEVRVKEAPPQYRNSVLHLSGALNVEAMRQAVSDIVGRHEALGPWQNSSDGQGLESGSAALHVVDSSPAELHDRLSAETALRANQIPGLPFHAVLLKIGVEDHVLLLSVDRTVCDDRSQEILMRDLGRAYAARAIGVAPVWELMPLHYNDFLHWRLHEGAVQVQDLALEAENAPSDAQPTVAGLERTPSSTVEQWADARTESQEPFSGSVLIPSDVHQRLQHIARKNQATLRMVLQAAIAAFLVHAGMGTKIPLVETKSGRTHSLWNAVVGSFQRDVLLEVDVTRCLSFTEVVQRVKLAALAADELPPWQSAVGKADGVLDHSSGWYPRFRFEAETTKSPSYLSYFPGLSLTDIDTSSKEEEDFAVAFHEQLDATDQPSGLTATVECAAELLPGVRTSEVALRLREFLYAVSVEPELRMDEFDLEASAGGDKLRKPWPRGKGTSDELP